MVLHGTAVIRGGTVVTPGGSQWHQGDFRWLAVAPESVRDSEWVRMAPWSVPVVAVAPRSVLVGPHGTGVSPGGFRWEQGQSW